MSLLRRLLAYLLIIHGVFLLLTFSFYRDQPVVIVGMELGLIFSLAVGIYLVKKALQPFGFAQQFHDLLQDESYAARIRSSSNVELNEMITLYNHMLEALYQERLKLGEQRGFLERLLEATPTAVVVFDFDDKISLMNASAQALFGFKDFEGQRLEDLLVGHNKPDSMHDNTALELIADLNLLAQGDSRVLSDKDGKRYRCQRNQFIDRGFKRDFVLIDEITEELASSEKATYEKLVRVLAHEVNNTVAATSSVLESLLFYRQQLQQEDGEDFYTAIAAVQRRNGNLGEFIERFTLVVKMPDAELQANSLPDILEDILHLYRQQCHDLGIELSLTQSTAISTQMLDRHLFEQALLNVIKNAIEAVEAAQKNTSQMSAYVRISLTQDEEKQSIKLSITDSARQLSNIPNGQLFSPFFSTKKGGQGIGLMFVREVLNRHGFQHRLAANAEGETEFSIWMPPSA